MNRERARMIAQVVLGVLALAMAAGAGYRYQSTREAPGTPLPKGRAVLAEPASGPVGMHPVLRLLGWPNGAVVAIRLCAPGTGGTCADLAKGKANGRIRGVPVPATLTGPAGPSPVSPGSYELWAQAPDEKAPRIRGAFRVVPFVVGPRPTPRSFASVDAKNIRLGAGTEVATSAPCTSSFLPDGRLLIGKTIFDPRTLLDVDLPVSASELAWSPRGDRLAMVTEDRKEIRIADPGGTGAVVVVREARGLINSISWSHDGEHLAFVARPQPGVRGGPARAGANLLDLTGGERSEIGPAEAVEWSPTQDSLALEVIEGGKRVVKVVDVTGKGPTVAEGRGVAWSPDGTLLAVIRGDTGPLVVTRQSPPAPFVLADEPVCGAAFAPDGSRVAVVTQRAGKMQLTLRALRLS